MYIISIRNKCQKEILVLQCIATPPDWSHKQLHVFRFDMVSALTAEGFQLLDERPISISTKEHRRTATGWGTPVTQSKPLTWLLPGLSEEKDPSAHFPGATPRKRLLDHLTHQVRSLPTTFQIKAGFARIFPLSFHILKMPILFRSWKAANQLTELKLVKRLYLKRCFCWKGEVWQKKFTKSRIWGNFN